MKSIKELRGSMANLSPQECSSDMRYFVKQNLDWDVYLPTRGKNLQRGFVWTIEQKRELIWSVLIGRHIPHCAIINIVNRQNEKEDIWQIIDGKQRLSTIVSFFNNEFTLVIDGEEYFFKDLPKDYSDVIHRFNFRYYVINEPFYTPITDDEKIAWFKFINFAGTPQDVEHLNSL